MDKPSFNSPYIEMRQVGEDLNKLSEFYIGLPTGYSDIEYLQVMRKQLSYMLLYLADHHSKDLSLNKVYYEKKEKSARAESYEETMKLKFVDGEYKELEEGDKMMSQKDREILMHRGRSIAEWTDSYSKAYGSWKEFLDLQDAIKSIRDCISADVRILTSVNNS